MIFNVFRRQEAPERSRNEHFRTFVVRRPRGEHFRVEGHAHARRKGGSGTYTKIRVQIQDHVGIEGHRRDIDALDLAVPLRTPDLADDPAIPSF